MRTSAEPLAPAFSLVSFDLESAPKLERKADPPKEKKKAKPAEATSSAAPATGKEGKKEKKEKAPAAEQPAKDTEASPAGKAQKKEKKEKKPAEEGPSKKGGNTKAAAAEDAGEPVPSMIDLRVGHIVDSESVDLSSRVNGLSFRSFASHEAPRC